MSETGIIAIGRNEGERLRHCLQSVSRLEMSVVYVDSNSTDCSVELARSLRADIVQLDLSLPFSAARARNAGFERLLLLSPNTRFVQFVDGDCEMVPDWMQRAQAELEARPDVGVVCGRRRERFVERSIYNRLADLEWDTPIGETRSCGGDAMMRVEAFQEIGGYDPSVMAGEEPELCQRLRNHGWKILRIDAEMTLHDSEMLHFRQWWRRTVRSGYGAADVASRFGSQGLFVAQVRSARVWAVGWPLAVIVSGLTFAAMMGRLAGILAAAIICVAVPAQILRLALRGRRRMMRNRDALVYGILTMIGKWANLLGQLRYLRDRFSGQNARLIEYKQHDVVRAANP